MMRTVCRLITHFAALCLVMSPLALAGCAGKDAKVEPPAPFTHRIAGTTPSLMVFSGNTRGHRPGEESAFELILENKSSDIWEGYCCVELLDRDSVITLLATQSFALQPGEVLTKELTVRFPNNLAAAAYGLAVSVPDSFGFTETIYVGENVDDVDDPSWAEPSCWETD
jgi:hypothetical protein